MEMEEEWVISDGEGGSKNELQGRIDRGKNTGQSVGEGEI